MHPWAERGKGKRAEKQGREEEMGRRVGQEAAGAKRERHRHLSVGRSTRVVHLGRRARQSGRKDFNVQPRIKSSSEPRPG